MIAIKPIQQQLEFFFTRPHHPAPLGIFRVLIASFVLVQAAFWYHDWLAFFGPDAWVQWEISRAMVINISIHISQVAEGFEHLGLDGDQAVMLFFWIYTVGAVGLLVGLFTRFWACLVWLCHYIMICSIDPYIYGVDIFLQIALFYIMIMPVARAFSLDAYFKRVSTNATWTVTLSLRVLQIHLCLAYLSAGYEKMLAAGWWDGNVLWRSLVQPDFREFELTWLADSPWILMLLSWFTMVVETGYCIGMWVPRVRVFWLAAIISLHAGIALFLGLWLFALIMILLSLSAFGYDAWRDIRAWQQKRKASRVPPPVLQEADWSRPIGMVEAEPVIRVLK